MADFHDDQVVPFEINHISLEFFGDHEAIRDLAWKQRVPEVREDVRRGLLTHEFHNIGRGHRPGIGKTIQERSDAKEMVAVTVGDINRCQVLAARRDPIYEDVRLLDGDKGVDEDGVSLARDKCRRYRRPHQLFRPGAKPLPAVGMPGVTNTSQFSIMSRSVATSVISCLRQCDDDASAAGTLLLVKVRALSASRRFLDYRYNPYTGLDS